MVRLAQDPEGLGLSTEYLYRISQQNLHKSVETEETRGVDISA